MIVAIVITSWVGFSRIVRGEVMKIKQEKFVEGLRGLGQGTCGLSSGILHPI
ncbi:MAG: hypothetical protein ACLTXL_04905 [Clostridia bacterium]